MLDLVAVNSGHVKWVPSEHVKVVPQELDESEFLFFIMVIPNDRVHGWITFGIELDPLALQFFRLHH